MSIKGNEIIEKRNVLNEVRKNNMNLQELRFFSIYLSKINARKISTRQVRFPLSDFQKIMDLKELNIYQLKETAYSLLRQVVDIPMENGGFVAFPIFKKCVVDQDEFQTWYIEMDAHDDALPLMFDFKKEYFTYELWNTLNLSSRNQIRMYEILKQYEKIGERKMTLPELRDRLGLSENEYPRWNNFKTRVIDSCQVALEEHTDIKFTYELIKSGRGNSIIGIRFFIEENKKHKDVLGLMEFLDDDTKKTKKKGKKVDIIEESIDRDKRHELCFGLEHEFFDEFSFKQLEELVHHAWKHVDKKELSVYEENFDPDIAYQLAVTSYIRSKILKTNATPKVKNRYAYIKTAIINDFK